MKNIIIVSCLLFLVGCSQTKMVKDEVIQLKGKNQLLQVNYEICNDYKSNSAKVYGCSSSFSKDLEISKSKSLLNAKSEVIDTYNSSFNQSQTMLSQDNKKGIVLDYDNKIVNQISDTVLNYKVEYSKTFQEANGFRTFTVISMDLI